jgi:hypothetical protein
MKIWIGNEISVETVTAVPCIEGEFDEENRQPALYIIDSRTGYPDDMVIFGGYEPPTTEEELEELFRSIDWYELDRFYETIETIRR